MRMTSLIALATLGSVLLLVPTRTAAAPPEFLVCSTATHSPSSHSEPISSSTIKQLLYDVVGDDAQAFLGFTPSIIVENTSRPNAFARSPYQIVLTRGLLETVPDRSELSFIVAHELGHLVLGHKGHGDMKEEIAADALAVTFVKGAGLSPCAGADVLQRLTTPQIRAVNGIALRLERLSGIISTNCVG